MTPAKHATLVLTLIFTVPLCAPAVAEQPPQRPFQIVADGKAVAAVVFSDQAKRTERYAAEELVKYLRRISGAELPIFPESSAQNLARNLICLGATRLADQAGVNPTRKQVGYDGYVIKAQDRLLIIRGRRPKGTVFGVYQLLEGLGCRFYGPWQYTEIIPKKKDLSVRPIHRLVKPAVTHRFTAVAATRWSFFFRKRFRQWLLKIGLSDPGPVAHAQTYGFHWFMPEDEYYDAHPEWYALHFGKRVKDSGDLCVSNPQMREEFARNVIAWFREHGDQTCAPINAHDGPARCQCDECAKLDDPRYPQDKMRRMLVFANDIARRVTGAMPDKKVGLYAYYAGAFKFPDDVKPHPAIMPCFFPQVHFDEQLPVIRKWTQFVDSIYLYYWIGMHAGEPVDWLDTSTYDNFATVIGLKTAVFYPEIVDWSPAGALQLYLMAHKAWDARFDVPRAQARYFKHAFGPAAATMRKYYLSLQKSFRQPHAKTEDGRFRPATIEKLNGLLNSATQAVAGLAPDYKRRTDQAGASFRVKADLAKCRALTNIYAATRNETDRIAAATAVEDAVAYLKTLRNDDVLWTDRFMGPPYLLYPRMRSVINDPPRTRFESPGPFKYYYDSMYEGHVTLADAVEAGNVYAQTGNTYLQPNSTGELVYEFLAPENAVFQSCLVRPCPAPPTALAQFSCEISTDAGATWTVLVDRPQKASEQIDISSFVKGKTSFLLRYRGRNSSERKQSFVDNPILEGTTVEATGPVKTITYWDGWTRPRPPIPPAERPEPSAEPAATLPAKIDLFRYETDLGCWAAYHQGLAYHTGKGHNDDSCLRMWENEGPGSSYIAAIPVQPGEKYTLSFYIHVTRGKAVVRTEADWKRLALSRPVTFEPTKTFRPGRVDIEIPNQPIDAEKQACTISFVHEGAGAEFFVDDVVLRRIPAKH